MSLERLKTKSVFKMTYPELIDYHREIELRIKKDLMKIALAQLNYHIGNFEGNVRQMLDAVAKAKEDGADIICFSELATCGYPPRDFLEFDDFIRLSEESIEHLELLYSKESLRSA